MLLEVEGPLPPPEGASTERLPRTGDGPYRVPPPGLACVPCGRPASRSYALRDWSYAQGLTVAVWRTWTVHVPACRRCHRKRELGQALLGVAVLLAPVAFPMLWDLRIYVTSVDRTLLVGSAFGCIGVWLAALTVSHFNRWFMPVALERVDAAAGRTTLWVRDEGVAERMRAASTLAQGSAPAGGGAQPAS